MKINKITNKIGNKMSRSITITRERIMQIINSGDKPNINDLLHALNGTFFETERTVAFNISSHPIGILRHKYFDLSQKTSDGLTPMHLAALYKRADVLEAIIEDTIHHREAYLEAKDMHGKTALIYSAQLGDTESMKLLLKAGANKNAQESGKKTAIRYAANYGKIEAVKLLIESGASLVKAEDGVTPIGNYTNPEINKIIKAAQAFDTLAQASSPKYLYGDQQFSIIAAFKDTIKVPEICEMLVTRLISKIPSDKHFKSNLKFRLEGVKVNLQKLMLTSPEADVLIKIISDKCDSYFNDSSLPLEDAESTVPAVSDAYMGYAPAGYAPAGGAASHAPAGGAASHAPAGGAASHAPAGVAASHVPAGGAASHVPAGGAAAVESSIEAKARIAMNKIFEGKTESFYAYDIDAIIQVSKMQYFNPETYIRMALQHHDSHRELGELKDFISKIAGFLNNYTGENLMTFGFVSLVPILDVAEPASLEEVAAAVGGVEVGGAAVPAPATSAEGVPLSGESDPEDVN